ncbi:MAG: glycosyltransferase family 2 protein [Pseudomonadota bacterium]|nr:glycosyltransferase family 2 protein [Pseudomonadota bacterium]
MYAQLTVAVVIPARNEEALIGTVVAELLALSLVDQLVVCDNGSTDATAQQAQAAGAQVVYQPQAGYGIACLTALAALKPVDIIVFTDGDHSFKAGQIIGLLESIVQGNDLVIGSRRLGHIEAGALTLPQRWGNRLAGLFIYWLWGTRVTDLGPYRAIRAPVLSQLNMRDHTYGWTIEMQIKAIQQGVPIQEVAVDTQKRRGGRSKVGGTVCGVIGASIGILTMIAKLRWQQRQQVLYQNQ